MDRRKKASVPLPRESKSSRQRRERHRKHVPAARRFCEVGTGLPYLTNQHAFVFEDTTLSSSVNRVDEGRKDGTTGVDTNEIEEKKENPTGVSGTEEENEYTGSANNERILALAKIPTFETPKPPLDLSKPPTEKELQAWDMYLSVHGNALTVDDNALLWSQLETSQLKHFPLLINWVETKNKDFMPEGRFHTNNDTAFFKANHCYRKGREYAFDSDDLWMTTALTASLREGLNIEDSISVGCCIRSSGELTRPKILSVGWNGFPPALEEYADTKLGDLAKESDAHQVSIMALHAETNAIFFADRRELEDAVSYVTLAPCPACASLIIQAGISKVIYLFYAYDHMASFERFRIAGIVYEPYIFRQRLYDNSGKWIQAQMEKLLVREQESLKAFVVAPDFSFPTSQADQ